MSLQRILRINELLQQQISKILLEEIEIPEGHLVTIIRVDTAPNLKSSKIWISIFPYQKRKKVLRILKVNSGKIQFLLNRRLTMHPLPRIMFKLDATEEKAEKIEETLNRIAKELNLKDQEQNII